MNPTTTHTPRTGGTPETALQEILTIEGARGQVRRAMHQRLTQLGVTDPGQMRNLIGNASFTIEAPVALHASGEINGAEFTARMEKIHAQAQEQKQRLLHKPPVRGQEASANFPSGAIHHYNTHQCGLNLNGPAFSENGPAISAADLHHAISADIRMQGTVAALGAQGFVHHPLVKAHSALRQ
jgi:hypothetical protein